MELLRLERVIDPDWDLNTEDGGSVLVVHFEGGKEMDSVYGVDIIAKGGSEPWASLGGKRLRVTVEVMEEKTDA